MSTKREVPLHAEPLWYLRGLGYGEYLHTDHWRLRRQAFLEGRDRRCERCGLSVIDEVEVEHIAYRCAETGEPCSPRRLTAQAERTIVVEPRAPRFHVHHLTYERLGCERDEDLELLCAPCHNLVHFPDSHAGRWWRERLLQVA